MHRGWLWPIGLVCVVGALYWAAQIDPLAYLPGLVHAEHRTEAFCSDQRASYGCLGVRFEADARLPTLLGATFKREPLWIQHKVVIYQLDDPKNPSFRRPIKEIDLMSYPQTRYKRRFLYPRTPLKESISYAGYLLDFSSTNTAEFTVQSQRLEDRNNVMLATFEFEIPPLNSP